MTGWVYWIAAIAVMALVTYVPQVLPLTLFGGGSKDPFLRSFSVLHALCGAGGNDLSRSAVCHLDPGVGGGRPVGRAGNGVLETASAGGAGLHGGGAVDRNADEAAALAVKRAGRFRPHGKSPDLRRTPKQFRAFSVMCVS